MVSRYRRRPYLFFHQSWQAQAATKSLTNPGRRKPLPRATGRSGKEVGESRTTWEGEEVGEGETTWEGEEFDEGETAEGT